MQNNLLKPIISFFLLCNLFSDVRWTMADVEAAHKQGSYVELADHIMDITPANRKPSWALAFKDLISYQIDSVSPQGRNYINLDTLDLLKQVLSKEQLDSDFLFKVGKFVRLNSGNASDATVWFADAINEKTKAKICSDEDVRLAVLASLYMPEEHKKYSTAGLQILENCWQELRQAVKAGFSDANGYFYKNTCKIFIAKEPKGLSELIKQECADNRS